MIKKNLWPHMQSLKCCKLWNSRRNGWQWIMKNIIALKIVIDFHSWLHDLFFATAKSRCNKTDNCLFFFANDFLMQWEKKITHNVLLIYLWHPLKIYLKQSNANTQYQTIKKTMRWWTRNPIVRTTSFLFIFFYLS